ncbi:MAG: tetratricopeptide repeat protein [Cyclobacteriaceae bacterium]
MRPVILLLFLTSFSLTAQQSVGLERIRQTTDEVKDAWQDGRYRAVLSMLAELSDSGPLPDDLFYMEVCASARLRTGDAEKKLLSYVDRFPFGTGLNRVWYELALLYYQTKKYSDAALTFNKVDFDPLTKEMRHAGLFYWGYSLFSQKKLAEAKIRFDQLKLTDGVYGPAASYYAGFAAFSNGDFDSALGDFQRIQKEESYMDVVPYLITSCMQRLGRYDELIRFAEGLDNARDIQNFEEITLLVSEATFSRGQFSAAAEGYNKYLKTKRTIDRNVLYRAGYSNFQLSAFNDAIGYFKQVASEQDSTGTYAAYYLGISYLKIAQKPFALTAFQTCIRSKFSDKALLNEARYQEAKLLYDLGRPDEAIERMENFVANEKGTAYSSELAELLSGAYVNANHYHKAISYIESLSLRTPSSNRAYQKAALYYGFEFYNKGDYDQALNFFGKALDFPLDESLVFEASVWAGEAHASRGAWEAAIPFYEKVILASSRATEDQTLRARYGLGYARFNTRDYERSLISFREFTVKAPKNDLRLTDALIRLGDCYYVSRSYQAAYDQYRRASDTGKSGADYALMQSGVMLGITGKNKDGIRTLEEMLRKFPNSVYWDEAVFQKAQLEFQESGYLQAANGYSALISRKPGSRFVPFAHVKRAAALFNLKEYDKTASDYIKVLRDFPGHPASQDILLPLQEALNLAGRGGEFSDLLTEFKERNPGASGIESVEFDAARNLYLNQEYSGAIKSFNSFINSYPGSLQLIEAKFLRAESYYRTRDFKNALSGYYEIAADEKFINAARISARIAELESKASDWEKAIVAFRNLLRLSSTPKDRYTAWAGLMDGYYLLGKYDSALAFSERLQSESGISPSLQHRASLMSGKVFQAQGDFERATDNFITTINEAQDDYGAEAKYRLAEIYFNQKNHRQCYETILSLNRDYSPHTEWVGKGFLLLSESFLETGETFQARATLQSLDKFPLESVREQAKRRLALIDSEEKRSQTIPSDSTEHE